MSAQRGHLRVPLRGLTATAGDAPDVDTSLHFEEIAVFTLKLTSDRVAALREHHPEPSAARGCDSERGGTREGGLQSLVQAPGESMEVPLRHRNSSDGESGGVTDSGSKTRRVLVDVLGNEGQEADRPAIGVDLKTSPGIGVLLGVRPQDLQVGLEVGPLARPPQHLSVRIVSHADSLLTSADQRTVFGAPRRATEPCAARA